MTRVITILFAVLMAVLLFGRPAPAQECRCKSCQCATCPPGGCPADLFAVQATPKQAAEMPPAGLAQRPTVSAVAPLVPPIGYRVMPTFGPATVAYPPQPRFPRMRTVLTRFRR